MISADQAAIKAWHFLPADRHTRWNRQLVTIGQTLKYDGELILCQSGLHASVKALDALQYAPGPIVCCVELGGNIIRGEDKLVASERTCLAISDATETLRYFARWCALSVIDTWHAPQVVLDYLMTGDENIRAAAGAAARDAAWAAARAAAGAAAGDAAGAAAGDAAWDAAWDAARAAAWDAAGDAARAAARDAQERQLSALLTECIQC